MSIEDLRKNFSERGFLTAKELQTRWGLSSRSLYRVRDEFKMKPADYYGLNPLFSIGDIERVEKERAKRRLKNLRNRPQCTGKRAKGILTVKEAKRAAGKGAK